MPVFNYYIKTSRGEARGSILANTQAEADTALRAEFLKTYRTGTTAQTIVTPTLTTLTIQGV